jgi:hypothetical protein
MVSIFFNRTTVSSVSEISLEQESGILPEKLDANIYHFAEIIFQSEMILEGSNSGEDIEDIHARL